MLLRTAASANSILSWHSKSSKDGHEGLRITVKADKDLETGGVVLLDGNKVVVGVGKVNSMSS